MQKKTKLIALISLGVMMFMLLTGCVRSGVGVVMNADGTGTLKISYGVKESYYDSMKDQYEADMFEGKETERITDGGETYVCYAETKQFTSFDELKTLLLELEYDTSMVPDESTGTAFNEAPTDETNGAEASDYGKIEDAPEIKQDYHIFKEVEVGKSSDLLKNGYTFRAVTNKQEVNTSELAGLGIDMGSMFKLVVTVTMPDNISEGSGTVDGNTMVSTITDLSVKNEITAVSEGVSVINIIIIVLAIMIVSFIIYMLLRGKKQNTNN